jgi:endogenous inhibitor of DNA gyrase (YacG/DUF329 family)
MSTTPAETLCVLCQKHPVRPEWRPFCSERCKLMDLGAWASERHAIPGEAVETEEKPKTEDEESG